MRWDAKRREPADLSLEALGDIVAKVIEGSVTLQEDLAAFCPGFGIMRAIQGAVLGQSIRIDDLVDGQRMRGFNLNLLFWSFLAMFADGFDISVMPFAMPTLSKLWHVVAGLQGYVLTASLVGVLAGSPLLGYVGDRYGRKVAILLGSVIYGLTTLAVIWSHGYWVTIALRFCTGIGIGGLMPNTIALNSELSPRRLRATLVVLMFTGITLGSGAPGLIAAWVLPTFGWSVLFLVGGAVPLLVAACLYFALPESVKFLAGRPDRHPRATGHGAAHAPGSHPGRGYAVRKHRSIAAGRWGCGHRRNFRLPGSKPSHPCYGCVS